MGSHLRCLATASLSIQRTRLRRRASRDHHRDNAVENDFVSLVGPLQAKANNRLPRLTATRNTGKRRVSKREDIVFKHGAIELPLIANVSRRPGRWHIDAQQIRQKYAEAVAEQLHWLQNFMRRRRAQGCTRGPFKCRRVGDERGRCVRASRRQTMCATGAVRQNVFGVIDVDRCGGLHLSCSQVNRQAIVFPVPLSIRIDPCNMS